MAVNQCREPGRPDSFAEPLVQIRPEAGKMDSGKSAQFSMGSGRDFGKVDAEYSSFNPPHSSAPNSQGGGVSGGDEKDHQAHLGLDGLGSTHTNAKRRQILHCPCSAEDAVGIDNRTAYELA